MKTADHIADNSPNAVIAMIDEIESLRTVIQKIGCNTFMGVINSIPKSLQDKLAELEIENGRLKKEADWLCQHMNIDGIFTTGCPAIINEDECDDDCPKCWREAARKAVEAQDASS